jgi:hypothetical protein
MDALAGYGSESEAEDAVERVGAYDNVEPDAESAEPLEEFMGGSHGSVNATIKPSLLPSVDDLFTASADSISKVRPARDSGIKYFSSSSGNGGASRASSAGAKSIETLPVDRKAMDREAKEYIERVIGSKAPPASAGSGKQPASSGAQSQPAKNAAKDELTAKVIYLCPSST